MRAVSIIVYGLRVRHGWRPDRLRPDVGPRQVGWRVTAVEGPAGAAGADFCPEEAARLAPEAIPFTATFEDPRFPGMRFSDWANRGRDDDATGSPSGPCRIVCRAVVTVGGRTSPSKHSIPH